jgi:hypothetical protein
MLCRPKDQGGLGIEALELKNKCLLSKWLFKFLSEEGMWQQLLSNKYLKNKTLSQVEVKPTDSPFWKGLMHVKEDFSREVIFESEIEHPLDSGRTCGWETHLCPINILHCIILLNIRMC